jgi:rfaE bifunctional protein nucleotidyltransferase chain/domain
VGKVVGLAELHHEAVRLREAGKRIAFANGHFDLLHVGHLRYLEAAAAEGDVLVVGINDDDSVARLKGRGRPIIPASERAELLAALEPVDYVVIFEGDSPGSLLAELQPEAHCKGTDYATPEKVPEHEIVKGYGGRTVLVGDPKNHSTTDLISRARAADR